MKEEKYSVLQRLAAKIESGLGTEDDLHTFNRWFHSFQEERSDHQRKLLSPRLKTILKSRVERRIASKSRLRWLRPVAAAAILMVAIGAGWLLYIGGPDPAHPTADLYADVIPSPKSAILRVEGGTSMELLPGGQLVNEGNQFYYGDGTLLKAGGLDTEPGEGVRFATLETPRGGTYKTVLDDGTKVWLNAESRLRYPLQFEEGQRVVEVVGEAYFEVKRSDKPFIVQSRGQKVVVLGTHFSINAYAENRHVKTILAEGKVRVEPISGDISSVVLEAGQGAYLNAEGIQRRRVNLKNELAWKEGLFAFEGKPFDEVMSELARWYDLQIVYENGRPDTRFFGYAHRTNSLSLVLGLLESAEIHYSFRPNSNGTGGKLLIESLNK